MAITPPILIVLISVLLVGIAIGALVGWLSSRPARARLQSEIEKDRAVHAERLQAYQDADGRLRESFQALSSAALNSNNEAFLHLAETRLTQSRTEATADIDARKKAIEELLAPMAKTLDQVEVGREHLRAPGTAADQALAPHAEQRPETELYDEHDTTDEAGRL